MIIERNTMRSIPSIFQKKKKKVKGYVDRITNGIVVIIIRNPKDNDTVQEVFVPVSKFTKRVPEEGDYVCVTIDA